MSFLINPFTFAVAGGDFESIATVTVGSGGAASIEFTSIPSTFAHLQVRWCARSDRSGFAIDSGLMQVNSDTGNNYAWHRLTGDGSSAAASAGATQSSMEWGVFSAATATASAFACGVFDILDYTDTTKNTTFRFFSGYDSNGAGRIYLNSGLWIDTDAVTGIKLYPNNGNLVQHSTAALFGVKAP